MWFTERELRTLKWLIIVIVMIVCGVLFSAGLSVGVWLL